MARHAASPPPRRAQTRARTVVPAADEPTSARSLLAGGLLGAGGAVVAALTVGAIAATGVGLAPRGTSQDAPTPSATPTVERASLAATPAQTAIAAVLGTKPAPTWSPAGSVTWTAASPFDEECGRPGDVDAALAAARAYTVGRDQVLVSVWAFSAGQGAPALAGWSTGLGTCASSGRVGRVRTDGPGGTGVVAWLRPAAGTSGAAMLMWRRGDVIAAVAVPTAKPDKLAERAAVVDAALMRALAGRCADISSTRADAARSPWTSREQFTGLTQPLTVTVDPSPTPAAQPGADPVPDSWSPTPLPSVSLPERPVDPVWPADLPVPVGSPVVPQRPTPAPVTTSVPSRVDDTVGPGCGWAFTGQVKPPYDEATEDALTAARAAQAEAELAALQAQWQSDVVQFWRDVPVYEQQAALFADYAESVRSVATAWDAITRQRQRYASQVEAYNAAVAARDAFLAEQANARALYESEVARCGTEPSPLPTPSTTPTPGDTSSPVPTPEPTAQDGCPPVVPPILYESPPELPPLPTPPPDPRPSPTG
ncbi:MAG: hypothetical protein U0S36_07660 [Candidatus Nanopelagicales bacterium]